MPQLNESDEQLLTLLSHSDEEAFTTLFHRYNKMLYALAYKYLKSYESSEDAVQQVFLRLWEGRQFITINVNLRNYLYTMVKNLVLNEIRNNNTAVTKNYELSQFDETEADDLIDTLEKQDMVNKLHEAIDCLSDQKRKVCLLKLRGDLSNQEIADRLHLSVPTVKTHYAQSIKLLKDRFSSILMIIILFGMDNY